MANFQGFARQPHHALDVVHALIGWVLEHNDVAALGLVQIRDLGVGEGDADRIGELGHEDVIADLQGGDHRARGNLKGLDNEGAQEQRHAEREANRLGVLPGR